MTRVKVLEWNVNNRNKKSELPEWVGDEIAKKKPDIFCLVEWRDNDVNKKMIEKNWDKDTVLRHTMVHHMILLKTKKKTWRKTKRQQKQNKVTVF